MAIGLVGRKVGMTQVFDERGKAVPVTVIQAGPCPVVQRKTADRDGYEAIQIGFETLANKNRVTRPVRGHFDKAQTAYQRFLREIRLRGGEGEFAVGQVLTVTLFSTGDRVRVSGITKGRGFQGGVKRWNYKGGPMTHGSMFHRAPGSSGRRPTRRGCSGAPPARPHGGPADDGARTARGVCGRREQPGPDRGRGSRASGGMVTIQKGK